MRFVIILFLLVGCASIQKADKGKDQFAKQFKANDKMGTIYIYRNEILGGAIGKKIYLDEKLIGETGPKSYFFVTVNPGPHTIRSEKDDSILKINVNKNEIKYVWLEIKMGAWVAGSKLQETSKEKGQKGVLECDLIDSQKSIEKIEALKKKNYRY